MKDEKRGIIISLIIWVLLMFMTLTRWIGDGILKEIGDHIWSNNYSVGGNRNLEYGIIY